MKNIYFAWYQEGNGAISNITSWLAFECTSDMSLLFGAIFKQVLRYETARNWYWRHFCSMHFLQKRQFSKKIFWNILQKSIKITHFVLCKRKNGAISILLVLMTIEHAWGKDTCLSNIRWHFLGLKLCEWLNGAVFFLYVCAEKSIF